jgi:hypothetical protein
MSVSRYEGAWEGQAGGGPPIIEKNGRELLVTGILLGMMAVAALFASARGAWAQGGTGQIKGVVTDQTGAVVPGAQVTAVSLDTGFTRSTVSHPDGSFLIPLLEPSHYRVQILAPGFAKLLRGPITVQLTETADIGNLPLTVGEQSTTVTVTGEEALLQTENATLGKVFDSTLIEALPLSTRNFTQLLSLQAGVIGAIPSTLQLGNGTSQFSVGGGRVYDNAVSIDGVNAVSSSASGSFSIPSPDALQEFKVQTSVYSAEYSRAGGGNVDVTTKSGSNHFHGDGFYFFRNKALDANSYFNKQGEIATNSPNVPADLRQNQWGGTVGGPVKRDKLFFFFSFQSTNQINGNAGNINNYVYPLIPAGDRSNTGAFRAALGTIYGGQTGIFGGTAVAKDGSNINPVAIAILQAKFANGNYVLPSFPQSDFLHTGQNDISYAHFSLDDTYNEKQYMGNMDYKITARQTLSTKYFDSHSKFSFVNAGVPGFTSDSPSVSENAVITHTFTLSSTLVNELKLGYLRQVANSLSNNSGFTAAEVGMIAAPDALGAFPQLVMGANGLIFPGVSAPFPDSSGLLSAQTENQFSISDVVSKSLGRHNLRFGGVLMDHELDLNTLGEGGIIVLETADFLIGEDGVTNGSGLSNLLGTGAGSGSFQRNFRFKDFGYFLQDDFKVRPNLTLNLGLRWDYYAWPSETQGRLDNFVRDLMAEGQFGIPTAAQAYTGYTISEKFKQLNPNFTIPGGVASVSNQNGLTPNYKNYAPRAGFAWTPYPKTSVRGGFGLFFTRSSAVLAQDEISGPPFNNLDLYTFGSAGTLQDPFGHLGLPPDSAYPQFVPRTYSPTATPSLTLAAVTPKIGNPYTEQWNLSVQQEFAKNFLFELAYQGQNGVKLLQALSQNQAGLASAANPIRGITTNTTSSLNIQGRSPVAGMLSDEGLSVSQTSASSHFNALEATLTKRLSYGLQFLSAFTWSKDMDSNTVGLGAAGSAAVPPNDNNSTHHMSISGLDRTLRFTTSAVYNIPNPIKNPTTFAGGVLSHALGGWGMATGITAQTGGPISFELSNTTTDSSAIKLQGNLTASLNPGYDLSDVAGSGPAKSRLTHFFKTNGVGNGTNAALCAPVPNSPSALACPAATAFGNLPTNTWLRNPGQKTVDFSLTKTTKVHENYNVEVRADFFNFFNWVNFSGPDSGITDTTFGVINGTTVDPRVVQVSAKVKF